MIKKSGIKLLKGQVWSVGKKTKELVKEVNNLDYEIGEMGVRILDIFRGDSLILVMDIKSGLEFDVKIQNLGKCLSP